MGSRQFGHAPFAPLAVTEGAGSRDSGNGCTQNPWQRRLWYLRCIFGAAAPSLFRNKRCFTASLATTLTATATTARGG